MRGQQHADGPRLVLRPGHVPRVLGASVHLPRALPPHAQPPNTAPGASHRHQPGNLVLQVSTALSAIAILTRFEICIWLVVLTKDLLKSV